MSAHDPLRICPWCRRPTPRELERCDCAPSIAVRAGAVLDRVARYCRDCAAKLGGMLDYHHCLAIVPTEQQIRALEYLRILEKRRHELHARDQQ